METFFEKLRRFRSITWKDADQNLCTLAASILDQASGVLRTPYGTQTENKETETAGEFIPPGFADKEDNRGWWTIGTYTEDAADAGFFHGKNTMSVVCWYSFQNLVRMRLKQAREELRLNLYGSGSKIKRSSQASRNPVKRLRGSKFGRKPER